MTENTVVKYVQVAVPQNYKLDQWFESANPEEISIVLDLAGRLHHMVGDAKNDMAAKLYAARKDGTDNAIKKVLEQATKLAECQSAKEITELKTNLQMVKAQNMELQQEKKIQQEKPLLI